MCRGNHGGKQLTRASLAVFRRDKRYNVQCKKGMKCLARGVFAYFVIVIFSRSLLVCLSVGLSVCLFRHCIALSMYSVPLVFCYVKANRYKLHVPGIFLALPPRASRQFILFLDFIYMYMLHVYALHVHVVI